MVIFHCYVSSPEGKRFKDNMTNEPMVLGTDTELLTDAHMDSFPFWIGIRQIFKAMNYDLD